MKFNSIKEYNEYLKKQEAGKKKPASRPMKNTKKEEK